MSDSPCPCLSPFPISKHFLMFLKTSLEPRCFIKFVEKKMEWKDKSILVLLLKIQARFFVHLIPISINFLNTLVVIFFSLKMQKWLFIGRNTLLKAGYVLPLKFRSFCIWFCVWYQREPAFVIVFHTTSQLFQHHWSTALFPTEEQCHFECVLHFLVPSISSISDLLVLFQLCFKPMLF